MIETLTHSETDLRYPIGRFRKVASLTPAEREAAIESIAATPIRLRAATLGLTPEQLDTTYRPGGWTVRQVIHHVPDSHINSYVRFKLALTEDNPTIKTYDEARWAELEDGKSTPVEVSFALLEALHDRWVRLLRSLGPEDFARTVNHPDHGPMTIDSLLGLYDWHGKHHVAHITRLRQRMGWS
ncbi:MAG TPA: putative metal-dependent hydrolase [Thermoanaerobaculia bacterium]|nr:putative metal-dependent hydrolase [Thermoanaerobaculia bacterium]